MSAKMPLEKFIMNLRKSDIIEAASMFDYTIPSSWNKERMAHRLSEIYQEHYDDFLSMFNMSVIVFIRMIFEDNLNGKMKAYDYGSSGKYVYLDEFYHQLEFMGLIHYSGGVIRIPEFLRNLVLRDFDSIEDHLIELDSMGKCALGIIDAYGILEEQLFLEMFTECYPHLSTEEIVDFLSRRIELLSCCSFLETEDGVWRFSYIINDPESWYLEMQRRKDIPYKKYTRSEYINIATIGFARKPKNYDILKNLLTENGMTMNEAVDVLRTELIEHFCQLEINTDLPEFLEDLVFNGLPDAQHVLNLYADFINDSPVWLNKGYTPSALFMHNNKSRPLKERPGLSDPYPGISPIGDEKNLIRNNVIQFPSGGANKEPGRNDPCPCGSGKKYKNCCGRTIDDN